MEQIIYATSFLIGIMFGSFFSLAIYRIPLAEDIIKKRSFCPNCNHRLEFLDLIPILSYIFLKGKCRYCKEKIRIRYLLLEMFSGIVFLVYVVSINIKIINIFNIIYIMAGLLYITSLFIIVGIDKEHKNINKNVFIYGIITELLYLCVLAYENIYRYDILFLLGISLIKIFFIKYKKTIPYWLASINIIIIILLNLILNYRW